MDTSACVKGAHLKNFGDVALSFLTLQISLFLPVDQLLVSLQFQWVSVMFENFPLGFSVSWSLPFSQAA